MMLQVMRDGKVFECDKEVLRKKIDQVRNEQMDLIAKRLIDMWTDIKLLEIDSKVYLEEEVPWIKVYFEISDPEIIYIDKSRNTLLLAVLLNLSSSKK